MRLTERDLRILRKVHECRWLSTRQIKRYFFRDTTDRAVNKRLRLLVDAGYLGCDRTSSTEEYFFKLGLQGRIAVAEAMDIDPTAIEVPRKLPSELTHFSRLNDLRYYCEISIGRARGIVESFRMDWELKGQMGNAAPIVPDALCSFRLPCGSEIQSYVVAFEYAHTETVQYFGSKVKRYGEALQRGQDFVTASGFKVVVLADTRNKLRQLVLRYMKIGRPHVPFLFGAFEDLESQGDLFGEIFIDPHGDFGDEGVKLCSLI